MFLVFEYAAVVTWMNYLQPDHLQATTAYLTDVARSSLRRLSGTAPVSISPSARNKSVSAAANATNTLMQNSGGETAEGHKKEAQVKLSFSYQVTSLLRFLTYTILTISRRSLPILLSKERHGSPFITYQQKFRLSLLESTAPISSTTFTDLWGSASFCHCLRSF